MAIKIIPLGLDIETSTNNHQTGVVLQIGIAYYKGEKILSREWLIQYPPSFWNEENWSSNAYLIHQISKEKLNKSGLNLIEVDVLIYNYLKALDQEGLFIPVGFNVGGFDLLFIKKQLPKLYSLLSHRTIELNSFFLLHSRKGDIIKEGWVNKKKMVIDNEISNLKENKLHSAGFDAKLALLILNKFSLTLIDEIN